MLTNRGPGTPTEVTNYYVLGGSFNFSYREHGSAIATLIIAGVLLARRYLVPELTAGGVNE